MVVWVVVHLVGRRRADILEKHREVWASGGLWFALGAARDAG